MKFRTMVMTEFKNVWHPEVGDYIILPGCSHGCHARQEGVVVEATWVQESRNTQYTLLTVLDTVTQTRFQVKHTLFNDDTAPEGAVNWFF